MLEDVRRIDEIDRVVRQEIETVDQCDAVYIGIFESIDVIEARDVLWTAAEMEFQGPGAAGRIANCRYVAANCIG
jgi:hypothetical protein